MKNGVPFDTAFGVRDWKIDKVERRAMSITFSCFRGAEYDWTAMKFKDPPK